MPYDSLVEYIESSGTQWIDTGIFLYEGDEVNFVVEIKFIIDENNESTATLLSSMQERSPYPGMLIRRAFGTANVQLEYNGRIQNIGVIGSVIEYRLEVVSSQRNSVPTTLFCGLNAQLSPFRLCRGRLYYFRLFNKGRLVCDYVPVRKNNEGFVYDKVTQSIVEYAGSGSFIPGPDVD